MYSHVCLRHADTCTVAIGRERVLEVKDTELQHFRAELGFMALGIKQMLEKQSPDNVSLSNDDQEACKIHFYSLSRGGVDTSVMYRFFLEM